jgi:hypothetical protein
MNQKTLLIVGGALVVGAFLLGFVPQYLKRYGSNSLRNARNHKWTSLVCSAGTFTWKPT